MSPLSMRKPASPAPFSEVSALVAETSEKARQIEIRTRKAVAELLAGGYRSVFRGRGMDFDEVREYVAGDDVRAIDWNVTARSGTPHIKKFREERELTVILAVDVSASGDFGSGERSKRELGAELASALALSAAHSRDRVGLVLFSDRVERFVPPASGKPHALRLVHEILGASPQGTGTNVVQALRHIHRTVPRRAAVLLVTDFAHQDLQSAALKDMLAVTAHRHELLAFCPHDPHELSLPDVGWLTLEDAETGEVVVLDTGRRKVRARYRALAQERRQRVAALLQGAGADVVPIDITEDYLPRVVAFFRARGRGRS